MESRTRRVVGVDYGTKRVGLAVADPLRLFAQPQGTYPPEQAVRVLRRLHETDGIEAVVVGWPLTPDGEEGAATQLVQPFINRLKNVLRDVVIVKWDERYTSEAAREVLLRTGIGRKARREKGRVDAVAAALILQEYLDAA